MKNVDFTDLEATLLGADARRLSRVRSASVPENQSSLAIGVQ
ncbi:MAG: hypothetical protein AzoDbin1_03442 [Azoarcus sp.]|nr:hypothetical protein [Aromatoleum toluolicum]MCK9986970.1 hypothetical protein [Azoarcus sp.]MCQ6963983.1 hypothetical protein [Aromatoleum toluolicum]